MSKIEEKDLSIFGLNRDDTPRFLYHYTTFESFLKIIETGQLKMCSLSGMNDPYEFVQRTPSVYLRGNPTDAECFDAVRKNKLAHTERANCVRLASLSVDNQDCCIQHKGWFLLNMWASYADDHRGVCLVFDYEKLTNEFTDFCQKNGVRCNKGRIMYKSELDGVEDMFGTPCSSFTDESHIDHLFVKPDCFEKEQEYRLLAIDESLTSPTTPLFIPCKHSLCGVITGCEFPFSRTVPVLRDGFNQLGYDLEWFRLYFPGTYRTDHSLVKY